MEARQTAAELALLVSANRSQLPCCSSFRCARAEKFGARVQAALRESSTLCVEVVKCLDCVCGKPSHSTPDVSSSDLLLEQWTISVVTHKNDESPMTVHGLFQAVRSQLHFSQLSAWRSSSHGLEPRHVSYRLATPPHLANFVTSPDQHLFPLAKLSRGFALKVCVRSLPRMESIPRAVCTLHRDAALQDSQSSVLLNCGATEASLRPRKYCSPPSCRPSELPGLDGEDWNVAPHTTVARRRGRRATVRRRDAHQTVEVVDDRMRNPCTRPGKHRCSCGDEDELELEPSYIRSASKIQLSSEELGEVLAVLRDKNIPGRSFAQVTNTSSSTKKQLSSRLNIENTTGECLKHSSSASACDKNGVLVNTVMRTYKKSDQQDGSESSFLPDGTHKHKCNVKLKKSDTYRFSTCDKQNDVFPDVKSINLAGSDNPCVSIKGESKLSQIIHTSVISTDLKQTGRFDSSVSSDRPTQSHKCVEKNSVRTSDVLVLGGSHVEYCDNIQNGTDMNLSVASRTSSVNCSAILSVQTNLEVPFITDSKSRENKSRTRCGEVEKKLEMELKEASERGEIRQVPSAREKLKFRRSLDSAASLVFHCRTGLPLTSSPAPIRRTSTSCFDFDSSLNSVSAIRSALFESSEDSQSTSSDDTETPSPVDTVAPAHYPEIAHHLRCGAAPCSSLLGSFEESVLNGRLEPVSTVQGFTADLGASGSFCPRHMVLPVTVFFYTLGDNDKVSAPYLAHINLGKKGYNVPRSGTIQLTLFNPLGTVVKMFVVMYDLCDMPTNSQTFLRQRTLYMPASSAENHLENAQKWLRYLIHLRFCSSKSGRIYLHTDIRMIIFRKADEDTATGLGPDIAYELRSFTRGPTNPKFSPRQ